MTEETKNKTFEKSTHQQKWLVEQLMYNLKNDEVLWQQGWITRGAPESAITGKKYRGSNNFLLTIVAYKRGYRDNRWVTYNQIEEHSWKFKTDAEGKSLGKGAGVPVEFYSLHDRKTKKAFEKSTLFGMNDEEQQEYMKENVFPIRRSYYVFNADLIDGIPELEHHEIDPNERVARADKFLQMWSEKEVPIIHGGSQAYYSLNKDEIHLPPLNDFLSLQDYYSTAFHETGHSTGHQSRLNRKLDNKFGTPEYAEEELRAEIASMFLGQEFGVSTDTNAIRNNSAYVKAWIEKLEEDPSVLFKAIADANNIMKYIVAKEQEFNATKEVAHYAIVEEKDFYDNPVYKVYMTADYGQTRPAISFAFSSKEALLQEFGKMQELPFWKDKTFVEVSKDELDRISVQKAEKGELEKIESEPSDVFIPPTEIVAKEMPKVEYEEMKNRGVETLTRMDDRDVVERASKTKSGEKFNQLYNGISVLGSEEKDESSLMTRIAMFVNGDKEQLIRVFKSSKQFRTGKPIEYYEKMADKSLGFIASFDKGAAKPMSSVKTPKSTFSKNAKV